MFFRPLPVLTLFVLPALALLLWLGSWQLGRMTEKAEAISAWESNAALPAIDLETALCDEMPLTDRHIEVELIRGETQLRFYGRGPEGEIGWRLFTPIQPSSCRFSLLLAETGFETLEGRVLELGNTYRFEAYPLPGAFTPQNTVEDNAFYRTDISQFAAYFDDMVVRPDGWLVQSSGLPPRLTAVPPSQHLGYALTWFGLAIVLVVFYVLMHARNARLGFTRR